MSIRTMRQRRASRWIMGLALAFALGGCANNGEDTGTQPLTDQDQIRSMIDDDEEVSGYFDLDAMQSDPADMPAAPSGLAMAPIETLLKWRRFRHPAAREISIEMSEGLAFVSRVTTYEGTLGLLAQEEGSESAIRIEKPLVDRAERHAVFVHLEESQTARHPHGGWRLAAISPIEVESRTGGTLPTVAIVRMQVDAEGQAPWVLEAAALTEPIDLDEAPTVPPGAEVTVTIETEGAPAVAFLHARAHRQHAPHPGGPHLREEMTEGPEGVFTHTFTAPEGQGRFHLAADLLTEGSLYESDPDAGPYDSNIWGIPFQVHESGESGDDD